MKRIITTLALLCFISSAIAQTYIKTNALYWLGGIPNVQVETRIANHFTFQGEVNSSLWTIDYKPMMGMQNIAGFRYYPSKKGAFNGFYVGGDAAFDCYNVSKWDHWRPVEEGIDIQHGVGLYLGVTLGYQLQFAKRWNLDFFVGGGWHHGWYWGETKMPDGSYNMYAAWNKSGEWIPYKIGVTFGYRLTSEKRMQKRFGDNYIPYESKKRK